MLDWFPRYRHLRTLTPACVDTLLFTSYLWIIICIVLVPVVEPPVFSHCFPVWLSRSSKISWMWHLTMEANHRAGALSFGATTYVADCDACLILALRYASSLREFVYRENKIKKYSRIGLNYLVSRIFMIPTTPWILITVNTFYFNDPWILNMGLALPERLAKQVVIGTIIIQN